MNLATPYHGPIIETPMTLGGRTIRLARPADPDRLLDDPAVLEQNRLDDYMPYWAYLWPGAYLLAEAVGREPWPPGTEALEIGCGLGLAGLVGMASGLKVQFTDFDETPLRFVERSVEANGFPASRFTTSRLDWRDPPPERVPLILGADVLYEHRLVPLVLGLIQTMLEPDGLALVAGPYRVASDDLGPALDRFGLTSEATPIEAIDESGRAVRGTLQRIRKVR